ncbi:MAG: Panacea domain-containing protein [Crocinitomicaceae bacterium]|nr:Panacea domain-containing protein [Crocinitomicaceae bacterium]
MKILWLSDKLHLMRYGCIMLEDSYVAMPRGPVPTMTMNIAQDKTTPYVVENISINRFILTSNQEVESKYFSESEVEAMDEVWSRFGGKDGFELEKLSHYYPEWQKFEDDINDESKPSSYPMDIEDFFEMPSREFSAGSEHAFFANEDIELAKEIYQETRVY